MVEGDGRRPEVDVDEWFDSEHPRMVGLGRRVVDPDSSTPSSLEVARGASVRAFAHLRFRAPRDRDARIVATVRAVLDECLPLLMGNPATVRLRLDALGDDVSFDGTLDLAELHDALQGLGRRVRHSGMLSVAAGLTPVEVSAMLDQPLDVTLEHLAHVSTRLTDRRRLGLDHLVGPT
jgi:hypothetical protein